MDYESAATELATHYRAILESAVDYAIISSDLEGRVATWNDGARHILGWSEAEIAGQPLDLIFTPEDRQAGIPQREMNNALAIGRSLDERWHQRQDGSLFWASGEMMPLKSHSGETIGFLKILRDRTQEFLARDRLERTAEELRQSEAKLRLSLEASRMAVWDFEIATQTLIHSSELNRVLGFPEDARPTMEEIRARYYPGELERLQLLARETLSRGDKFAEVEFRYVWPDGRPRWMLLRAEIVRDEQKRPLRYSGVIMDITERRTTQEGLRRSEAQKTAILEAALDAIITIDQDSRIIEWNRAAEAMFDRKREEVVGKNMPELIIPPEYRAAHRMGMERFIETGQGALLGRRAEFNALRADGSRFPVELAVSPIHIEGALHFTAYLRDLTQRRATEKALRESNERLRDITDALPFLISYADGEQRYRFVNKPYESWLGLAMEDIVGRTFAELMGPAEYEALRPFVERALAGEIQSHDVNMTGPSGVIHAQVTHIPHRDKSGGVVGMYSVVQDISERKQAQRAIEESETRFRQLADVNPSVVWLGDREGNLSYLNTRWSEFTGVPPGEALARGRRDFVHPEDRPRLDAIWGASSAAGKPYGLEARLLRHDGQYRWHQIRAVPVAGEDGKVIGWLGNDTDIHELVVQREQLARSGKELEQANRALEASVEQRTRDHDRLWQISQEIMLVRDFEGVILAVNPSATRILGWTEAEMVGRRTSEFLHPDDIEMTANEVARIAAGERALAFENRYRAKDGTYRLLDWTAVHDAGLIHAVARDITAEREAEKNLQHVQEALRQSQKMEAVGQLTGGIAHDFNNLLTGIIGSLDILNRRLASGRTDNIQRFMDAAITSANRAATLTQRLLAFGRRQSLDVRPVQVAMLVSSLDELLRRTLGENIVLETQFERGLWHARTDANQLENAILNLVINARDAMPQGGTVTISARNAELDRTTARDLGALEAGAYVALGVSDTGTGMSPDVLQRAFDPFYTTKPIGQGTGLGLSMIYGFASQTGGAVQIASALGEGTTVTLFLPRSQESAADAQDAEGAGLHAGAGETVLVVEDDPAVRMLVLEVLGDLGYQAIEASDARSALPVIESGGRIDLLISDVGLPGMNGRVLAEIARKHHPDLPVLFVTGYAEGASARSGFLEPGMQMITKPFALDALSKKIREIIERG